MSPICLSWFINYVFEPSRYCDTLKSKDTSYRCIITGISKSEAINVVQSIDSTEKSGT